MMDAPKPEIADSRLKGYFVRHDDLAGIGLQQLYCVNCGKSNGAIRFDDPDNGCIAVWCNLCLEKFGRPPLQESPAKLLFETCWLKRNGCSFPPGIQRLVSEGNAVREDILVKDFGNGDGIVITRFYGG